jgi:acetylornithine deacetylase/succinyl-diaminopimelate desuccinylase-like protein
MAGVDAVNLGPGDPRYAHADDEQVSGTALARTHSIVSAFLAGVEA